jgi:anti-anti-sigma regulatory factor
MVAARAARQNGFAMLIAGLQAVMVEIFKVSRFDLILPVFESVEAAPVALDAKLSG